MSVKLVPVTIPLIEADSDADGGAALAALLGARLPVDWPPEHHDDGPRAYTREKLDDPENAGWLMHYVLWTGDGDPSVLVGICGFTGKPVDGSVELGYSVVPSHQRRGIASEATRQLIAKGRERGATRFTAKTLPHLEPSLGVMRKLGFTYAGAPEEGVVEYALEPSV